MSRFAVASLFFLVACSGKSAEVTSDENALTAVELTCSSGEATFTVNPAPGGAAIEGALHGAVESLFVCRSEASSLVCKERPQNVHPGTWDVIVTKAGANYQATIIKGPEEQVELSCSTPARADPDAVVPKYAEIEPLIEGACSGCHDEQFGSLDKVKEHRARMLEMVGGGAMPRGNRDWKDTPDGQKLLDFLRNSTEL